jgi:integrase
MEYGHHTRLDCASDSRVTQTVSQVAAASASRRPRRVSGRYRFRPRLSRRPPYPPAPPVGGAHSTWTRLPGRGLGFCREDGVPLHPDGFSDAFERHSKAVGLPSIRVHDVRHTWATLALRARIRAKVVSEVLGHANIGIMLDTYSHAIPAMQEEAAQKVAALIFPR